MRACSAAPGARMPTLAHLPAAAAGDMAFRIFCTPELSHHRTSDHHVLIERARFHLRNARRERVATSPARSAPSIRARRRGTRHRAAGARLDQRGRIHDRLHRAVRRRGSASSPSTFLPTATAPGGAPISLSAPAPCSPSPSTTARSTPRWRTPSVGSSRCSSPKVDRRCPARTRSSASCCSPAPTGSAT